MKHTIYGVALLFTLVLVIAGAMIVSGKDVRENEVDKALNTAVEQTLEQLRKDGGYEVKDPRELIADFQQALLMHISSDCELQVRILTADIEKGVLDVEVRSQYKTVRGANKQAVCRKTVILEEYSDEGVYHIAEFLVDGVVYEKYTVYHGGTMVLPPEPEKKGYVFQGWKNSDNHDMLKNNLVLEKNMTFYAVFQRLNKT